MAGVDYLAHGMIGDGLRAVRQRITVLAKTDLTVLILGESGVGKELAARALAEQSGRSMARFLSFNSAVLTETLAESLLFGHLKGAFTGALENREGHIAHTSVSTDTITINSNLFLGLTDAEAAAVLVHEMAHFAWGKYRMLDMTYSEAHERLTGRKLRASLELNIFASEGWEVQRWVYPNSVMEMADPASTDVILRPVPRTK
ncbi:MAG TPA: sigma 54-interacting transcriptional regulator [Planctomycetota bacterium]|nr:sigma 54-interacting transcriptional regulator [Planctomycetota bacterium]